VERMESLENELDKVLKEEREVKRECIQLRLRNDELEENSKFEKKKIERVKEELEILREDDQNRKFQLKEKNIYIEELENLLN
jgi:chromosome segregation ATPase